MSDLFVVNVNKKIATICTENLLVQMSTANLLKSCLYTDVLQLLKRKNVF